MVPGVLGGRERSFLLGALLYRDLDAGRMAALAAAGLDWHALRLAAERVGLAAAAGYAVLGAGLGASVPPAEREALERALAHNTARNASLLGSLVRATGLLAAEGIAVVPIKGMALLLTEPGLRPVRNIVDIDLLVRSPDLPRAGAVLKRAGWRPLPSPLVVDEAGAPVDPVEAARELQHGVPLADADGHVVELHVALPAAHGRPREASEPFFARAVARRWRGTAIPCPSPDDALGIACEHVLLHHRRDPVHLPRLVFDVQATLASGADPARAKALLGPEGAATVDEALEVVAEVRRGADRASRAGRGRVERLLSPLWIAEATWLDRLASAARLPGHVGAKVRAHGVRGLFPSRRFMEVRYGLRPGSPALPLYYAWRPVQKLIDLVTRR